MTDGHDLVMTIGVVAALMSLLLIVAALGYVAGGTNAPRNDPQGWAHEERQRTAPRRPHLDPNGDPIPPRPEERDTDHNGRN